MRPNFLPKTSSPKKFNYVIDRENLPMPPLAIRDALLYWVITKVAETPLWLDILVGVTLALALLVFTAKEFTDTKVDIFDQGDK